MILTLATVKVRSNCTYIWSRQICMRELQGQASFAP